MDLELRGKHALLTGASKGIGRAIAEVLAEEGCNLTLVARSQQPLDELASSIRARSNVAVSVLAADMATEAGQRMVVESATGADIVVNNAGANPAGEIDEISDDVWRNAWDLKLFGYINLTRAVYSAMKQRQAGVIINIIGNSGERMDAAYILGSSGNAGLMALTRALGGRSPDFGIRVVGVNPGLIATDRARFMLEGWSKSKYGTPDRWKEFQSELSLPFGRMGEAVEIANAVAFLASPKASYISGTIVTIDGGSVNRRI